MLDAPTVGGHLTASVRGIVFANNPDLPSELRGTNDESQLRVLVSCLVPGKSNVSTVNITTQGFPATSMVIRYRYNDPAARGCVADHLHSVGSEDKWFAVMGAEISGSFDRVTCYS